MSTPRVAVASTPQRNNGYGSTSCFTQSQIQQTYQAATPDADALSKSNPASNSRADNGGHSIPSASMRPARFIEEWDASQRGDSVVDGAVQGNMQRTSPNPVNANGVHGDAISLSRGNTLKKKASIRRSGSLKRSGSRRSMKAGSVRSLALQSTADQDEMHSAFYCPVPTSANPTEALANRFQAWRKTLKDLITYFREVQTHYEHRSKSLMKLANVLNNTTTPPGLLTEGGLDDALEILRGYNKHAIAEANKAREIEEDVILALTGLRSDLHQKIKEIRNLSGDFKNSVDKEMESTRKAVNQLQEALGQNELDPSLTVGKQDPYLLRVAVDRQIERQIDEENYLHQAYLNLENSGKELESIIVGEIQKAYNAYAGILKRESDAAYNTIEVLRAGPISMPKDKEWTSFIQRDDRFVSPDLPMRSAESIHYPGRDHFACQEIRAGLLERKSKYLKSYTPGWYVLSPTHLHEYKSADKTQAPLMSLYLPEQKLGSHSAEGSSSNKFVLKGRQTGSMHRGHKWVFRAESHDTMMAWYEDIKSITERTPEEHSNLVRANSRSISRSSQRSSVSSDGVIDDEEDPPFTATATSVNQQPRNDGFSRRPSGGRFPSDLQVNAQRGLQAPGSPLSANSGYGEYLNPADPSVTTTVPGGGFDQQPPSARQAGRPQETERDEFQRTTTIGTAAGTAASGALSVSSSVAATAQGRVSQDSDLANRSTAAQQPALLADRKQATLFWAEPVPIHPSHPHSHLSAQDGRPSNELYEPQTSTGVNGDYSAKGIGVRTLSFDGVEGLVGTNQVIGDDELSARPDGAVRADSAQTLSHFHIPGGYPKGPITEA
ncbi:uncharacterized protein P884DRAFT_275764 [Thermothelomyces heterothallicus CBS 202.75]|uniref:uncharacterized protein n=1 Tax=Thermothelomyces heterothallicus CBS 202.75 TaxID=1149848 RepID=UPI003742060E